MYIPKQFETKDFDKIEAFVKANPFALLVSVVQGVPFATSTPILTAMDEETQHPCLFGHIAKANPQWKNFEEQKEVLVIFQNEHAYISNTWYNHDNVPTWNYIAVHIYGTIEIIEGEKLRSFIDDLMTHFEYKGSLDALPPKMVAAELKGVVGFKIHITRIEAQSKLSQNRNDEDYKNVIQELEKQEGVHQKAVAQAMRNNRAQNE